MRRLIVTVCIGELNNAIGKLTHPYMQQYAEKIGADFVVIKRPVEGSSHWAKLRVKEYFNHLEDRILYVDTDVLITPWARDIFEVVPENKTGALRESDWVDREEIFVEYMKHMGEEIPEKIEYWNSGVMVLSFGSRVMLFHPGGCVIQKNIQLKKDNPDRHFHDQSHFNLMINRHDMQMFDIGHQFNRMDCMNRDLGEDRLKSDFVHYAGLGKLYGSDLVKLIENDVEVMERISHGGEKEGHKKEDG